MAFLVGHAIYEESLMTLLPMTPVCQRHIELHKQAHSDILRRLSHITKEGDSTDPIATASQLRRVVSEWLGGHSTEYDLPLTEELREAEKAEIVFDGELVQILDEFVFHHRPTKLNFSGSNILKADVDIADIHARLNTLTPRQKDVCHLIVLGNKNKQIAEQLGTTINTVKTHRTQIFRKMNVSSVLDLARCVDLTRNCASSDANGTAVTHRQSRNSPKNRSPRLLVIEPVTLAREAIVAGLEVLGYRAYGVDSLQGIQAIRKDGPADIMIVSAEAIRGADDLLEQILELKDIWSCKILFATGDTDSRSHRADIIDRTVAWPLDFGELSSAISELIGSSKDILNANSVSRCSP
ncbi:MAG: hypothetical protein JSS57_03190 [Proteobacteria bacterium]|nr:hypothetical protein [Pseudomonadota bacterium]